ncbi:amine oxidase [Xylaria bambusicola]|uniref:amine oxidase n=1 Tax=Xylaria bambusicola TaxID=326684 RepID=UPI002007E972|nr:amine oxidase [Xylaria bambusicola]KAI0512722.1 amine oxidase [Xylaria bambusicola]
MRFPTQYLFAAYWALGAHRAAAIPVADKVDGASQCHKTKVAILGAGVAGITAAQALVNASVTDFLIVDRNDYIGGRVKHTDFGKRVDGTPYTVELGANWVQGLGSPGGPENPIWTLAKKYGLQNTYSNYSSILTYDEEGAADFGSLFDEMDEAYTIVEQDAGYVLTDNLQDTSMRAAFSVAGWKPKKNMHQQAIEWWYWDWETAYSPEQSGFLYGITGYNLTFYQWSDENNFVTDPRGFNAFIIGEATEFLGENDPRLLLNTMVKSVAYGPDGVNITFEDDGCIEAEYAIATFSIGVLQNDIVEFKPQLPRWKQEAIEQYQMGTYTKVFFQFNETFWDTNTQYFLYADANHRGYYPVWQSLDGPGFHEDSHIIFVTVVGPESYRIEEQPDEVTKAECLAVLRDMFPDKDIPEPVDFMYPRWSTEEWAFGSYSNWPVGMTLEKHQNIRANVERLWFAGEGTSAQYYGFLQGAWFEGRDAGQRIAGLINGPDEEVLCNSETTIDCGPQAKYEVLHSTTFLDEYNVLNGWPVSSFLDYGYEE